ncbi:hypothetical protein IZU89_16225 [Cellulophaga lytica]|uniref:Uncharacterized protein n=1 Tax=Cellulophaga lytica (strain ATCC 23178 / DSM 7489 / JCM 8516 / NBRC 14961 / NCIMB 1423 / VKM B-1433 / Cy l20) TaxID=867900 RepID=F0RDE9_CELLC|nr:hypothetical protein [Cellulophaga lytica]ADY30891.1 hypothetical protein Celly_3074 [Cellulophaga lytica DSM 7489]MDO6852784.1 hypothetical protein [Cellulophaga lytica]WQG78191.1 hypothetical protein SR888_04515 [Cellulophaga lytica]
MTDGDKSTDQYAQIKKDTYTGLLLFYRDCDLEESILLNYKKNQILKEEGFTDVSVFSEGLSKNVRFTIATNKAINMAKINPDVAKFGFFVLRAPAYYKVLDIYKEENKTHIILLHLSMEYVPFFKYNTTAIDEQIIKLAKDRFSRNIVSECNKFLYEEEWLERTKHPIGMTDDGELFLSLETKN